MVGIDEAIDDACRPIAQAMGDVVFFSVHPDGTVSGGPMSYIDKGLAE